MPSDRAELARVGGAVSVKQDLAEEITIGNEMRPTAAAAEARAEIEARILAARKWPRDIDQFREDLLKDCRRPGFAEIALYKRPAGRKKNPTTGEWENAYAEGFSIRFMEAAIAHFQNIYVIARITAENADASVMNVAVVDLQRNTGYALDAIIEKLVERRELKAGRRARGMRENSFGDQVYLVDATKDEVRALMGAERSKLIRDNGRRLMPFDILAEARAQIDKTLADETAKDPDSAKKKILDRFAGLGVTASMLKDYLQRPLETLRPSDLEDLGSIYNGLKEGEFTWPELMRMRDADAEGEKPEEKPENGKQHPLRERVMGKAKQQQAAESKQGELLKDQPKE